MPRTHFTKAKLRPTTDEIKNCLDVNIEGYRYVYTQANDSTWSLENEYGRNIQDESILKMVHEAINEC